MFSSLHLFHTTSPIPFILYHFDEFAFVSSIYHYLLLKFMVRTDTPKYMKGKSMNERTVWEGRRELYDLPGVV